MWDVYPLTLVLEQCLQEIPTEDFLHADIE